jgi:LmbE family N-acetylglucosaminyl deacetylase
MTRTHTMPRPRAGAFPTITAPSRIDVVPGSILGVWAHPDDEAYLSAGLMYNARAAGHRVVVATATPGEHGTDDPQAWPPERLAAIRVRELEASLAAVGVHEHHWLGYEDGTLAGLDPRRGIDQVAALMDQVRPDTVVTFGPDGMTGHTDHRTISAWVTAAWEATGRRSRLWYTTVTPAFHARWGALNAEIGFWFDPSDVPSTPDDEIAYRVRCHAHVMARKTAALRAHASQTQPLADRLGERTYAAWWSTEWFRSPEASPRPPRTAGAPLSPARAS